MPRITGRISVFTVALLLCSSVLSAQATRDTPANGRDVGRAAAPTSTADTGIATRTGTGSISGRVVHRDDPNAPVRRAFVSLISSNITRRQAVTDDQGRFSFTRLPAGRYSLRFNKVSYAGTMYGGRNARAEGVPIVLADGQRVSDLLATMMRGCVVTGRVTDTTGAPIAGAQVTVYQRVIVSGKPVFRATGAGAATTDDRGIYRFYGFEAGDWAVGVRNLPFLLDTNGARIATPEEIRWAQQHAQSPSATPPPAPKTVKFSRVYAPGVSDPADAAVLTWGMSEEKSGVDIVVPLVSTASVSGNVARADGLPVAQTLIFLEPATTNPLLAGPRAMGIGPDGRFTVANVEPGSYTLVAVAMTAPTAAPQPGTPRVAAPSLWFRSDVTVSGDDVGDLNVMLQPMLQVAGRISFSGSTTPPDPARVTITLTDASGGGLPFGRTGMAVPSPDGSFVIKGMMPGTYAVTAAAGGGPPTSSAWIVESVTANGKDVLDAHLDIDPAGGAPDLNVRFTDKTTDLSGIVTDQAGKPLPDYSVIVFSTDRATWSQGSRWVHVPVRPGNDGRFSIMGLPPGEYYMAAISRYDPLEWFTPEFLDPISPASIKVTLVGGQKTVQDIRLR